MDEGQKDFLKNLLIEEAKNLNINIHSPMQVMVSARRLYARIQPHAPASYAYAHFRESIKRGAAMHGVYII